MADQLPQATDYTAVAEHFARGLFEALCREFDGFPDTEMRLETVEIMAAYKAWRDRPDVRQLFTATRPTNVTVCYLCGGSGVRRIDGADK
jgi:hypothetical protein